MPNVLSLFVQVACSVEIDGSVAHPVGDNAGGLLLKCAQQHFLVVDRELRASLLRAAAADRGSESLVLGMHILSSGVYAHFF